MSTIQDWIHSLVASGEFGDRFRAEILSTQNRWRSEGEPPVLRLELGTV